jgi:putative endonuclease
VASTEQDACWWVYLLVCADGSLYCGISNDVERRLAAHNAGRGARYTRGRGPVRLVWSEPCGDRAAALRREVAIKRLSRTAKQALIGATGA